MTAPTPTAFDRVTAALENLGKRSRAQSDGSWMYQCPAHDDNGPSLHVTPTRDRVLLYCHGGCERGAVLAALGLTDPDLYDNPRETRYTYTDSNGEFLRLVRRGPDADGGMKSFRQSGQTKGTAPLYRLPELAAAVADHRPVYLVEGEEDVHTLELLGVVATTAPAGATNFTKVDPQPLAGASVIAIVDRDEAGDRWAAQVKTVLARVGATVTFKVAAVGKDASDHIAAGHGLADFLPYANPEDTTEGAQEGHRRLIVQRASEITIRPVRWLWAERLALGTLALLAGREGLGKSTLAYWIAARITTGTLPGCFHGEPRTVIIASTEDSWEHTIVPRLTAAGADLDRVLRVEVETSLGFTVGLHLPHDIAALADLARRERVALLILDPIISRLDSLDTHRDSEVRQALEPLVNAADAVNMAILGLIHHNKGASGDPLNTVMGSKAFTAVSRSVHTVITDPNDESGRTRLFGTVKNNLGRDALPTKAFTIETFTIVAAEPVVTGRIEWGDDSTTTITEAMRDQANGDAITVVTEAANYLEDYLTKSGGEALRTDVMAAMRKEGFTESAVARARKKLGIISESSGFPRRSVWSLPVISPADPQSVHPVSSPLGESELTDMTDTTEGVSPVVSVESVSSCLQEPRTDWTTIPDSMLAGYDK